MMVVDRVNNADKKVEKPPLTLTKYRVHQTSPASPSSPSSPLNGNGNGNGKSKADVKAKPSGGGVLEVIPEDNEARQLEVRSGAVRYGMYVCYYFFILSCFVLSFRC